MKNILFTGALLLFPGYLFATCSSYPSLGAATITEGVIAKINVKPAVYLGGACYFQLTANLSSYKDAGVDGTCKSITFGSTSNANFLGTQADCIQIQGPLLKSLMTAMTLGKKISGTTDSGSVFGYTSGGLDIE